MADKCIVNINDVSLDERKHGNRFAAKVGRVGPIVGMTQLGCTLHVVPPGKRAYPFHAHHENEEMFFILSGRGEYRCGEETFPIKPGDVIAAPAGKTAHQLVNSGAEELRYLGISTIGSIDLVEYPDSNKFAVAAGVKNADFKSATFVYLGRKGQPLDYWEGEPD